MTAFLVIDTTGQDILSLLYLIFGLGIAIVGFYVYFTKEKKLQTLLIAIGAVFFILAALGGFDFLRNNLFENNFISPWSLTMATIGVFFFFLSVEPWKLTKQ